MTTKRKFKEQGVKDSICAGKVHRACMRWEEETAITDLKDPAMALWMFSLV